MALTASMYGQHAEINVTPLIDVLLVLLIIFMVIVPVTPRGLGSQIPQASRGAATALGPVSLRMLSERSTGLIRYELDGSAVERGKLGAALLARLQLRADRDVYVSASQDVSYGVVADAVSVARAEGASAVALGKL